MNSRKAHMFYQAITVIEAQAVLVNLKVATFPNMEKNDKVKVHKEFYALAYPSSKENRKRLSTKQAARIVARGRK